MPDGFDGYIHIEVRPIQVVRLRPFHIQNLCYGGILEPGKLFECKKELFFSDEQPESMPGDICNLSSRNVFAGHCGFNRHAVPVGCRLALR